MIRHWSWWWWMSFFILTHYCSWQVVLVSIVSYIIYQARVHQSTACYVIDISYQKNCSITPQTSNTIRTCKQLFSGVVANNTTKTFLESEQFPPNVECVQFVLFGRQQMICDTCKGHVLLLYSCFDRSSGEQLASKKCVWYLIIISATSNLHERRTPKEISTPNYFFWCSDEVFLTMTTWAAGDGHGQQLHCCQVKPICSRDHLTSATRVVGYAHL